MEYVENTLLSVLDNDPTLSYLEVTTWLTDLLTAFAHIHSKHVIHCDVKPDNILCTRKGHLILADFGEALRWDPT